MDKRIHWILTSLLVFFSPALVALGLGGAEVKSYLGQPLDVRVELINLSGEELNSVTAGLASVDDFKLLGMSRAAVSVPLQFSLVTDTSQPYIHITSNLKVSEPVLQVLVEVVWSSGRMLREYTLFLDPPTVDKAAPPAVVKPTPATASEQTAKPIADSKPSESAKTDTSSASESAELANDVSGVSDKGEEVYGPVAKGETLWGIASDFANGMDFSVNQAMLALLKKNPDAFLRENINTLKRGAILRMPAFSEMAELTSREAMLEAVQQLEEYQSEILPAPMDTAPPTVADSGGYQETVPELQPEPEIEEDSARLELVPPVEIEEQEIPSSGQSDEEDVSKEMIQEELLRTEEDLVNAEQENSYLAERIQNLEAEVAAQSNQAVTVVDSSLAEMETELAKQRATDSSEAPLAITPGGEKQPWYSGYTPLLVLLAVVLIALVVWGLRRRSSSEFAEDIETSPEPVDSGTVETTPAVEPDKSAAVVPISARSKPEVEEEPEPEPEQKHEPKQEPESEPGYHSEPEIDDVIDPEPEPAALHDDQDSEEDDPEIKLDLARAYLSLGDKEASRSMLDEVLKNGNEAQKAEAKQMLTEF